jgi:hypothetical protein
MLQCFVGLQVLWSHESENASSIRRTLRTICLSVEWRICNCIFNSIHSSINAQCSSLLSNLFTVLEKLINPETWRIEPTCVWCFWLRINSGIKSRNSNLTPGISCIVHKNADNRFSGLHYLFCFTSLSHAYIDLAVSWQISNFSQKYGLF